MQWAAELRGAGRRLWKSPLYAVVVIVTLALGIGVNALIFSVVSKVLLEALPYRNADQLVMLWETDPPKQVFDDSTSPANFRDWQEQRGLFSGLAAFEQVRLVLSRDGEPEQVEGLSVTPGFFRLLGVPPLLGRFDDDLAAVPASVVMSHALWQRRYGADPAIVGRSIAIDDQQCLVSAVMAKDFYFPYRADAWIVRPFTPRQLGQRDRRTLSVVGRLRPGVTVAAANTAMATVAHRLAAQYPEANAHRGVRVLALRDQVVGGVRVGLVVLMAAVGLVLLLALANVANLLLARSVARRREVAVRLALGAERTDLARQFLAEGMLLALLGGAAGLLLASWTLPALVALSPVEIPRLDQTSASGGVAVFTLALSVVSGLIFGLLLAARAPRSDAHGLLRDAGKRMTLGRRGQLTLDGFVVMEIALAFTLTVGASLLLQSMRALGQVKPGFEPAYVLTMKALLPGANSPEPRQAAFFQELLAAVGRVPGVEAVAGTTTLPLEGSSIAMQVEAEGQAAPVAGEVPSAAFDLVTPDYFRVLRIPMARGRAFSGADRADSRRVAVISESMAARHWPGQDPIGKRVQVLFSDHAWNEIVGVVKDIRHDSLAAAPEPQIYLPFFQHPLPALRLVIKTKVPPDSVVHDVRRTIHALDPGLPLANVVSLEQLRAASLARQRFTSTLLGLFAMVGLLLAVIGLYGVMAYSVSLRTNEIGIRMALGADRGRLVRATIARGMAVTAAGLGLGLLLALSLTRFLKTLLFEVQSTDLRSFAAVLGLFVVVGMLASFMPARRAANVEPTVALRYE